MRIRPATTGSVLTVAVSLIALVVGRVVLGLGHCEGARKAFCPRGVDDLVDLTSGVSKAHAACELSASLPQITSCGANPSPGEMFGRP